MAIIQKWQPQENGNGAHKNIFMVSFLTLFRARAWGLLTFFFFFLREVLQLGHASWRKSSGRATMAPPRKHGNEGCKERGVGSKMQCISVCRCASSTAAAPYAKFMRGNGGPWELAIFNPRRACACVSHVHQCFPLCQTWSNSVPAWWHAFLFFLFFPILPRHPCVVGTSVPGFGVRLWRLTLVFL
ncbi:hypothetical protein BC940DRAFT_157889 [Gongronella butleri]|nr:hypothetical protein BC940DRAFT_157889 [Gongronella butleri]